MDDLGYTLYNPNTFLFLCVVGGLALAFVALLVVDSIRQRKKRRYRKATSDFSNVNFISQTCKRTRQLLQALNEALQEQQRYKAKSRGRRK